ncbi:MAG: CPBP family intramembrane metalloprotease, partial [Clostridia bacterium]|nr:CPBP family intramembrane metalloprotease [Clostridia bacterium]
FRILEYFLLRTEQTFLGEAFVHKLLGIAILFIVVKIYSFKLSEVGFGKQKALPNLLLGLSFGIVTFILAYSVEILILTFRGSFDKLNLYVSAYSVDGNIGNQTAFIFFLICIIGNIINVIMEEGIFRGLFPKLLESKYTFIISAVIASVLFGLWHIMSPLRSYLDGTMSMGGFIGNSIMLITTSYLVGFKFAMMTKLTGNLYMAMGEHFVNNTIVNMLHVISDTGADELMVVRISIAQSVSFIAILLWYIIVQCKKKTEPKSPSAKL